MITHFELRTESADLKKKTNKSYHLSSIVKIVFLFFFPMCSSALLAETGHFFVKLSTEFCRADDMLNLLNLTALNKEKKIKALECAKGHLCSQTN